MKKTRQNLLKNQLLCRAAQAFGCAIKKVRTSLMTTGIILALADMAQAQTAATFTDLAGATPTPGPSDVTLLDTSNEGQPPGLNYYFDDGNPPGQTFTTGSNANGYIMTSLALFAAGGGGGGITTTLQPYYLRIYSVDSTGTNATLVATYISQNFTFNEGDWLQWTGLNVALQPNAQYAWSIHRGTTGWELLGSDGGDEYTGGQSALIPPAGGPIVFCTTPGYDAMMDIGLTNITSLVVNPPAFTPGNVITAGTAVTVSTTVFGVATYYQWQTDGGSGGALTNISGANTTTLSLDTSNLAVGVYQYDIIVSNSSQVVTSTVASLDISYPTAPATLTDQGGSILSGPNDISQLVGGGAAQDDGLNYYDDNGANNGAYAGQSFTTGTNSQGYYIDSVAIQTGGGNFNGTTTAQGYDLFVYSLNGNIASLVAHYTATNFAFTFGDWLQWGGFELQLKPNTTYAYGFGRNSLSGSWAALNTSPTNADLYPGGQICMIPTEGGAVAFGASGNSDGVFDVGLLPIGVGPSPYPFANAISASPSSFVPSGTTFTLSEVASGQAPLSYQWQTDGGSGGALANIPSSNASNLVVNTTGWAAGVYQYDVVVYNSFGSVTSAVTTVTVLYANTTANLTDIGATQPSSWANDVSQLNPASGANSPDNLNYYFDNSTPPGQTFTTGSSPSGYNLSSVAIDLAGNSGSLPAGGQSYLLHIYKMSGATATLYATYASSETNFTLASDTDWVRWSGFSLPLAANTSYAYSFGRISSGSGWDNLANVGGNPYAGGEVALIPVNGGAVSLGSSHSYDGVFVLGFALTGNPVVTPPAFSETTVYAGTPVMMTAGVTGSGPFTYQWQTDGGTGTYANIPNATNQTLAVDTTALGGENVNYALTVVNGSGATVGESGTLIILPAQAPAFGAGFDITNSLYQVSSQITTFIGGSVILSDTNFAGTLPITYQWQADGGTGTYANIPGATNDWLTLTALQLTNSGNYQLIAMNSQGTNQTSAANLTIMPQPTNPFVANFQFHAMVNVDVGNYSGTGATGFGTGIFWNQVIGPAVNVTGASYTSSSSYSDDGTTNCGINWTVFSSSSWGYITPPNNALLDSQSGAYGTNSFMFTLPNGIYNVVLFSCGGDQAATNGEGTVFTLNGVSQTLMPTTDMSFILNNNYAVFNNVVVNGATLTGTWASVLPSDVGNNYGSLNGAQIEYVGPAVTLTAQMSGSQLKLQWSQGTLLQATSLAGPWVTNSSVSPYFITPTGPQMFYRVKTQ